MVTSHDVARLAGVSQPTVSRALRDSTKVSDGTKQRVREAALALGYATNAIGRALSVGRSTRVGLVVTDLHNQFYSHVIAPMYEELERLGHELVLISESSETAPITEHVVANGLCGVVLATTTVESVLPQRLRERGIPFVYFNRTAAVRADSVTSDPEQGMRELVEAIVQHGHRRIGAVLGPRDTSTGAGRESALRTCLGEHGLSLARQHVRYGAFDFDTGAGGARALLDRRDPPSVIVCANDVIAFGALNAAVERGMRIPEDVSVVGFDDLPTSRWPVIQLSTVAYDLDGMSRAAARLIVSRVEQGVGAPLSSAVFPTRYVARRTLGPARP